MATLNTLRTRGGLIVSIVIGIALVAFLLGDLTSAGGSMFNAKKTRVGEINGTKIGYIEYSNQVEYYSNVEKYMSGSDALSNENLDGVRDLAWEQLVTKYAIYPSLDAMGIMLSETEQIDMVDGGNISPIISNTFKNPNTGLFDPALLRNFVSNISTDQTGRASLIWDYLKNQMNQQRLLSKFMTLIDKGQFVTDIEVEQMIAASNSVSAISYVVADYASIPDSTIKLSQGEIKKYYNEHQRAFRQTSSRDIEYVVFDVLPTQSDMDEANKYITEIATEFQSTENPFQYATLNSQTQPVKFFVGPEALTPALAAYAFGAESASMYGPVLEIDTYTLARVADTKMMPDSIGARHILLEAGKQAVADSIVTALKGGADFAVLAQQYSVDPSAAQNGGDLGIFPPEYMIPEFSDAAVKASVGDVYTVESTVGIHVVKLTAKSPLVKKVQLAQITYKVEPSESTQQTIYGNASKFVTDAAGTYEGFKSAATASALSKRVARIRNTDRTISTLDNSREVVRWAFNAKQGEVSPIVEINGDYIVASLASTQEDGIASLETVKEDIAFLLIQEKKADLLMEKLSGNSSLSAAAAKLNLEIKTAQDADFNSFYIDGIGVEPTLIGAITAVKPNTLSKPVRGVAGVFLFDVTSRETVETTMESERARLNTLNQTYIGERINQALMENSEIKDSRVKFF